MNKNLFLSLKFICCLAIVLLTGNNLSAQINSCGTDGPVGVNLICNGDFERGDSCFTTTYTKHSTAPDVNCGTCYRNWSNPDEYEVVTNVVTQFHMGFTNTPADHTSGSGNHFMAVDGSCSVGKKVWSQTVNVTPSTNYYFTMWYTSLHSNNPALLQFDINGTNVGLTQQLGPANGVWTQYTLNWASGSNSGNVTISIENMTVTGCNDGNDFAIDDISFVAGCQFGAAGPQPDLGPDQNLCLGPVTLNANIPQTPTTIVYWSTGVGGTAGAGPYSISVSTPGTYSVCVQDNGSCVKSDVIVVTANFSVNLGPDVTLCNPTNATLDAGLTAPGITYQWSKNNVAISGATSRTLNVTNPATYKVDVTIPGCGTQSDQIIVNSNAAIPNDATFCPPAIPTMSVTGTGSYQWYTGPSGGSPIATGTSYTPASAPAATTTYYVEDVSTFSYNVGPTSLYAGAGNDNYNADHSNVFDALVPFNLDAVTVYSDVYDKSRPFTIGVTLRNSSNAVVWSITVNLFTPNPVPSPSTGIKIVVPVNKPVPAGTGYTLTAEGTAGMGAVDLKWNQSTSTVVNYPFSVPGVISITGMHPNFAWVGTNRGWGYFYDWEISAGVPCGRVPVIANLLCTGCTSATDPASISSSSTSFCQGTLSTIDLTVTGGSGDSLILYKGSCNGTRVDSNATGAMFTIPAPASTTTYYAGWKSSTCSSACVSVTVTPVPNPSASSPGTNQNICNVTTATLNADRPLVGTGAWSVVSGTGTITTPSDSLSGVTGIGAGDLVLQWKVSNNPCPADSSQITIHRDVLSVPVITGPSFDTCASVSGIGYSTTVDNSPGSTYNWTKTGTLNIASQSGNTATVDVGASGGNLTVTETSGACVLSATQAITIAPNISPAVAGPAQQACVNSGVLAAVTPAVGMGQWSVASGSGVFTDDSDPQTAVTGLGNGLNVFTWTVYGCGGPSSTSMNFTVTTSSLVLDATGPGDTACVGTERNLNLSVTGGSGKYNYYWTSSDNSFTSTTSNVSVAVSPQTDPVIYHVFAEDTVNKGCLSNTDSVVIHTVAGEELFANNLLTPNLDGMNERLIIKDLNTSRPLLPGSSLEVYNRWGERVYKADSYDNSWGATGLTDGIYYYYLKAGCGGAQFRGWIQIIGSSASK